MVGFLWVFPVFPCHKLHSTISSRSSHSLRFISWSERRDQPASLLFADLHRISFLDPALCRTRVEVIIYYFRTNRTSQPQLRHTFPKGSLFTIIMSVLPKGRPFDANSGTKAAVLPKGRSSTANSGTKVAVLLLSLVSEQMLKDLRRSQGPQ